MGQVIDNRYKIIKKIGEGGMGAVYLAEDTRLERQVAIKRLQLLGKRADLDLFQKRFEREAKEMARFQHTNIVSVYDYGQDEEGIFLVLEYMPGGSLIDRMKHGPIPVEEAVEIIVPLAKALQVIHELGRVHRDIKPSNILFDAYGVPKLADFGIVKLVQGEEGHTLTATGAVIGTPAYMAPELIGGEASPKTDQYALGVVLYEMVTGKKPFIGRTPMETMLMQQTKPLPNPRELNPEIDSWICHVLMILLRKNPQDRFQDLSTLIFVLQEGMDYSVDIDLTTYNPIVTDEKTILPLEKEKIAESSDQFIEVESAVVTSDKTNKLKVSRKNKFPIWVVWGILAVVLLIFAGVLITNLLDNSSIAFSNSTTAVAIIRRTDTVEVLLSSTSTEIPNFTPTITSTVTKTITPTKSSTVTLTSTPTISPTPLPEGKVLIPDVVGLPYPEAAQRLQDAGLQNFYVFDYKNSEENPGVILAQSVEPDEVVSAWTTVTMTISGKYVGEFAYAYNTSSPFREGALTAKLEPNMEYMLFTYLDSCQISYSWTEGFTNYGCYSRNTYDKSLETGESNTYWDIGLILQTEVESPYTFSISCGKFWEQEWYILDYCSCHGILIRIN